MMTAALDNMPPDLVGNLTRILPRKKMEKMVDAVPPEVVGKAIASLTTEVFIFNIEITLRFLHFG